MRTDQPPLTEADISQLLPLLSAALSSDASVQKQAEAILASLETRDGFCSCLAVSTASGVGCSTPVHGSETAVSGCCCRQWLATLMRITVLAGSLWCSSRTTLISTGDLDIIAGIMGLMGYILLSELAAASCCGARTRDCTAQSIATQIPYSVNAPAMWVLGAGLAVHNWCVQ